MSFTTHHGSQPPRFRLVLQSFLQCSGLPFADLLPESKIQQAFDDAGANFATAEDEIYSPAVTLWAFLSQMLFKDEQRSCAAAVARVVVLFVALAKEPPADNTGAYCRARAKLPLSVVRRLSGELACDCENTVPNAWLWKERHVYLVDGTTVSMPDTESNQSAFPQHTVQAAGLGFPIARLVVLFSLATAMIRDYALGPYAGKETGETALLREIQNVLQAGDVLLADRYYCSWFQVALLQQQGVDLVTRQHQLRTTDFRRGRRLDRRDHLVAWPKPDKPAWLEQEIYDQLPDELELRELEVQVTQPGFRVETFIVVTTLTDARRDSSAELAELYHQRWLVELDIRTIKITLGLDVMRCRTPEMIRRELATGLLAYNLIRQVMLQSAFATDVSPRAQSFTAALQKIAASWLVNLFVKDAIAKQLIEITWEQMAQNRIGHRPDRIEPRAIKRRPKPHKLLTIPRAQAQAELLLAHDT